MKRPSGDQNGACPTSVPGNGVAVAQDVGEPAPDLLEHQVAHRVTKRVVDLLELIEVEDQERDGLMRAAGDGE